MYGIGELTNLEKSSSAVVQAWSAIAGCCCGDEGHDREEQGGLHFRFGLGELFGSSGVLCVDLEAW